MNLLRTVLSWVVLLLLWSAPFRARKQGKDFWQTGFVWKFALYFVLAFVFQALILYIFGAAVGVLGQDPGFDVLYAALASFTFFECCIVAWLIYKR